MDAWLQVELPATDGVGATARRSARSGCGRRSDAATLPGTLTAALFCRWPGVDSAEAAEHPTLPMTAQVIKRAVASQSYAHWPCDAGRVRAEAGCRRGAGGLPCAACRRRCGSSETCSSSCGMGRLRVGVARCCSRGLIGVLTSWRSCTSWAVRIAAGCVYRARATTTRPWRGCTRSVASSTCWCRRFSRTPVRS